MPRTDRRNQGRRGPINAVQPSQPSAAPVVKITLDKPRTMKYDFAALMRLEEVTGYSVLDSSTWENMKLGDVVRFLWAGLLHEDPDLTVEDVSHLIHFGNIQKVVEAIQETFHSALPTPGLDEGNGGDPTSGQSQRGSTSGQLPSTTSTLKTSSFGD